MASHSRFAPLRRPRTQTDVEFVKNAVSDARLCFWRAENALEYDPAFGDGDDATEEQAHADSVDSNDIAAAREAEVDARTRARHLEASAPLFDHLFAPDAVHTMLAAARDLVLAADRLQDRVLDFERFAVNADVDGGAPDAEELTAEEEALLEDPPVMRQAPRALGATGAPLWGVSDEDLERLWIMVREATKRALARCRAHARVRPCALSSAASHTSCTSAVRRLALDAGAHCERAALLAAQAAYPLPGERHRAPCG